MAKEMPSAPPPYSQDTQHMYPSISPMGMSQQQPSMMVVNVAPAFGPEPQPFVCPQCHAQGISETIVAPGLLTWIISGTLCVLGCWFGCCLIPCCMRSTQDVQHRCPGCKANLGFYKRL